MLLAYGTLACTVVAVVISVLGYYNVQKKEENTASAEQLHAETTARVALTTSLTGEMKRCHDECTALKGELREQEVRHKKEVAELKAEIAELRRLLAESAR